MKYDILIKDVDGSSVAEFTSVDEQTMNHVIQALRQGVDEGAGHEVPLEDIEK